MYTPKQIATFINYHDVAVPAKILPDGRVEIKTWLQLPQKDEHGESLFEIETAIVSNMQEARAVLGY